MPRRRGFRTNAATAWRPMAGGTMQFLRDEAGEGGAEPPWRKLLREQSGESMVAFALSASILFGFIFGLTEMCLAYYSYEWMSECAREGTRYAIVHGATCETSAGASCEVNAATVQNYVTGLGFPNVGGGTLSATASYPGTGVLCSGGPGSEQPGCPVKVTVNYTFPYKLPFVGSRNLSMSSTSEMTIIQ